MLAGQMGVADRILRRHAAIVFHLHLEIVARQDTRAEVENLRESLRVEPMIDVAGDVRLEEACFLRIVDGAAAVDEAFRDMPTSVM